MKVKILPGCTACGACEATCSDVFKVTDRVHVNENKVRGNESCCKEAAKSCPVNVIKIL
ncbi:MAG: ferredoxin [bacterium]